MELIGKQKAYFLKKGVDKYTIREKRTIIFDYVMNNRLPLHRIEIDKTLSLLLHLPIGEVIQFIDIDKLLIKIA
jgi:hypothetical protein